MKEDVSIGTASGSLGGTAGTIDCLGDAVSLSLLLLLLPTGEAAAAATAAKACTLGDTEAATTLLLLVDAGLAVNPSSSASFDPRLRPRPSLLPCD